MFKIFTIQLILERRNYLYYTYYREMGSCCDDISHSDSQRDNNTKLGRHKNQIKPVKNADSASPKGPAHYRQSSSVRNPNFSKENKGNTSPKSSNAETSSSKKQNNPLNPPSAPSNAPAFQSINQQAAVSQLQKQPFSSSSSIPKHERSFNSQVNTRLLTPHHQNQITIYQPQRNYGAIPPSRQNPQLIAPILPQPNTINPAQHNFISQQIIISHSDRPKEVSCQAKQPISQLNQQPLNQKFQNTVRDQQISQSLRYSTIELQSLQQHGLPNVGNTCYLNSILQMIFAADELIQEINMIAKKKRLLFHQLIANVSRDVENNSSYDKKKDNLIKVLKYIQNRDPEFSQYKQNDAIQCFLCVMNLLDEQYPSKSKLDTYFKIEYEPRCRCTNDGSFIIQDSFVKSKQFCTKCRQNISFLIHSTGPYIIIFSNSQRKDLHRQIQLETKENRLKYKNKAFVTYFGDKRSGHYIAHRKIESGWIKISDSSVQPIGSSSNIHNYAPMITLYSLKK